MNVSLPKIAEPSAIHDVKWIPLKFFNDARGWLVELFRNDLIDPNFHPVMAYVSQTKPGVARGPHEHVDQADYFCFFGPSTFRVYLWDARKDSPTFGAKEVRDAGENAPYALIVPAGVVHAYRNVGDKDGLVFNGANRLYAGWLKQDPVDEIRHEKDPNSPYQLD
ncbi:MAG: dTDP-4-dehydrorhamnose 3,5-epimerase family protein [Gemmataceae bacterium]|nr:dTDP-4-dehydrorhamnose 3,5-epimerase family protein [Gemmataceae bacterium]